MMNFSQYRALFQGSPYAYLVLDPDLVIVAANAVYLRSVERTEEDIVGRYVFDAFPPDPDDPDSTNISEVRASLLRALAKGETDAAFVRYSIEVNTPQGKKFEERYWSAVHTPVFGDDGKPMLVIQNPIDVTDLYSFDKKTQTVVLRVDTQLSVRGNFDHAQMHEALSRIVNNEREHLRSLFDQAPGFVAVLMGPKHVFEMVNSAYYQLVGHRELIGKAVWEALPEVAGQGYEEFLGSVYNTGKPWSGSAMPIAIQPERDGPIVQRYIDISYQPYRNSSGVTIGIFAQGYDVTESVKANLAVRESEQRLKQLANNIPHLAWMADAEGWIHWYNDRWYTYTGTTPEQMEGWGWQQVHHPDRLEKITEEWKHSIATGEPFEATFPLRGTDGTYRSFYTLVAPVKDGTGAIIQWFGTNTDITPLEELKSELLAQDRRKDDFLAMLAHELRNPLAPINTAAQMLALPGIDGNLVRRTSEVITRQVTHMTDLVDDLLDVSRVTRGLITLQQQTLGIGEILSNATEQIQALINRKNLHLHMELPEHPLLVVGDSTRLVQIFCNILNNAAKYTPENGHINVGVSVDSRQVEVTIEDDGIGIPQSLLPHIFELFTQAERTPDRAQGGLGLGLALVKSLTELHGGSVVVQSRGVDLGSTFVVRLPLVKNIALSQPDVRPEGITTSDQNLRLLIVDDNVDAADTLAMFLEAMGHSVSVEYSAQPALEHVRTLLPQFMFIDIGLPDIDGHALVRKLRLMPELAKTVFVAVSGYGQAKDKEQSLLAGFTHHLVKPVSLSDLQTILKSNFSALNS